MRYKRYCHLIAFTALKRRRCLVPKDLVCKLLYSCVSTMHLNKNRAYAVGTSEKAGKIEWGITSCEIKCQLLFITSAWELYEYFRGIIDKARSYSCSPSNARNYGRECIVRSVTYIFLYSRMSAQDYSTNTCHFCTAHVLSRCLQNIMHYHLYSTCFGKQTARKTELNKKTSDSALTVFWFSTIVRAALFSKTCIN